MSMDCDTRIMMMNMRERANNNAPRRTSRVRRVRAASAATTAAVASFALTLFTRGV